EDPRAVVPDRGRHPADCRIVRRACAEGLRLLRHGLLAGRRGAEHPHAQGDEATAQGTDKAGQRPAPAEGLRCGMALETWLAFFVACWVISLSPGAGAIASMSCGLRYGFWRGYWNAIGLQLAQVLQIAVVAAGIGAVLAPSSAALRLIRSFDVAYLLWLAYKQWQPVSEALEDSAMPRPIGRPPSLVSLWLLINPRSPNAIVFILAVLRQFL